MVQSLALDVMEPVRPEVDAFVFDMVEHPTFREPNSSIANISIHASSSQTRSWNRSRSFTAASATARRSARLHRSG
jgi:CRISPR/Cas system-associated endonuclease Cas1